MSSFASQAYSGYSGKRRRLGGNLKHTDRVSNQRRDDAHLEGEGFFKFQGPWGLGSFPYHENIKCLTDSTRNKKQKDTKLSTEQ